MHLRFRKFYTEIVSRYQIRPLFNRIRNKKVLKGLNEQF